MAKKNGWNADEMQGSLISDMEQEVKNGYQKIGESRAEVSPLGGEVTQNGDRHPVSSKMDTDVPVPTVSSASSQQGQSPSVPTAAQTTKREDEPTKGVQANLPISLYNRMKRLKFETDESFQSMFQRAMDLFLDVEEGKMKVSKAQ